MDVVLPSAGSYVVAVSGGVDSVTLLHMLSMQSGLDLTVAHFDHGMREDSGRDRLLVQNLAGMYDLPFVYDEGKLGPGASEAVAREARYKFLHRVRQDSGAQAIITAHHQDDVLETAIINLMRGTGRKGLTSLGSGPDIVRPLLNVPKSDLNVYARVYTLRWNEDETNQDEAYLRNYVRHQILPRLNTAVRTKLLDIIKNLRITNEELDALLVKQLYEQSPGDSIDRKWFGQLPHATAREVLASWLRGHGIRNFDSKTLERLVVAAKVAPAGQTFPIKANHYLEIGRDVIIIVDG